jgi:serine/threonine protein kinase
MEFLGQRNIYHGDLAARNILLTENLVAKVADFGLSKRLYSSLYSSLGDEARLPIKWLALETLVAGKASIKSDIWSYGVLMWEIFELGREPYRKGSY